MFGGIAGMQYFTDGYLAGIAVDPDMPIGSDVKASGCLVPVVYQDFSGANLTGAPKWIINNIKDTNTYIYSSTGKVLRYNSSFASETLLATASASTGN